MKPPTVCSTADRPRVKRKREKDEAKKRQGIWSASRKGLLMTCGFCGQPGHNIRRCPQVHAKNKVSFEDVPREGPEPFQHNNEFVFIPVPGMRPQSSSQASIHSPSCEPSTQQSTIVANYEEPQHEVDPILRPRALSEAKIRDEESRRLTNTGTRRISFTGPNLDTTSLPFQPKKLTWKGKEAMTQSQLNAMKKKKVGKLQCRRAKPK